MNDFKNKKEENEENINFHLVIENFQKRSI